MLFFEYWTCPLCGLCMNLSNKSLGYGWVVAVRKEPSLVPVFTWLRVKRVKHAYLRHCLFRFMRSFDLFARLPPWKQSSIAVDAFGVVSIYLGAPLCDVDRALSDHFLRVETGNSLVVKRSCCSIRNVSTLEPSLRVWPLFGRQISPCMLTCNDLFKENVI